jgi:uncharacterized protein
MCLRFATCASDSVEFVNPLLVNAAELLRRPGNDKDLAVTVTAEDLELVEPRIAPSADVVLAVHVESLSTGLVVSGTISTDWADTCRRCLADVGGTLVAHAREIYQVTITDEEAFPIVGDQIDLGPMTREAILLELPIAPLCKADCAGICGQCGADLNVTSCTCETLIVDDRWAALDALRDRLN